MIEEIKFSDTLSIWRSEYKFKNREEVVSECYRHINLFTDIKNDAFPYQTGIFETDGYFNAEVKNELDEVRNFGVNKCIDLYGFKNYTEVITDIWINMVRINPRQLNITKESGLIFHAHSDLNRRAGKVIPNYTFVIYVQMPNNLSGEDGVLYLKDIDGKIYNYLPSNGDCIIMDKDTPHVPGYARKSDFDRVVLAGNVTFQKTKTKKSIL